MLNISNVKDWIFSRTLISVQLSNSHQQCWSHCPVWLDWPTIWIKCSSFLSNSSLVSFHPPSSPLFSSHPFYSSIPPLSFLLISSIISSIVSFPPLSYILFFSPLLYPLLSSLIVTNDNMDLLPFCLLFLFGVKGQGSSVCPHHCSCHQDRVNCSHRSLTSSMLPAHFPPGTTQLNLHGNMLTTLPNGLLDDLTKLRSVSLHGNLWACDCGVLYLRAWLLHQASNRLSYFNISCSSPPNLRGRPVIYLTEEEVLESCHYWYCDLALASQVCLFVFVLVQVLLLVAVIIFLRRFERLTRELRRATAETQWCPMITSPWRKAAPESREAYVVVSCPHIALYTSNQLNSKASVIWDTPPTLSCQVH